MMKFKSDMMQHYFDTISTSLILKELKKTGEDLIADSYYFAEFANRTFNLRDSYGYGIYQDGILKERGYVGAAKATKSKEGTYGRTEIDKFLNEYDAIKSGFELIIVAAIWYAQELEEGFTPTGRKFVVISNVTNDMIQYSEKIKGSKVRMIIDGKKQ